MLAYRKNYHTTIYPLYLMSVNIKGEDIITYLLRNLLIEIQRPMV